MHNYTKYFKDQKGFDRFITALYKKYQSLGKISGTIHLNNLTIDEKIVLSKLFGTEYQENTNITIPIKKFVKIMENSKYEDFDINILVSEYLNLQLFSKNEEKDMLLNNEKEYYQSIIQDKNTIGNKWLKEIVDKKIKPYNLIHKRYNQNKEALKKELTNILTLVNNLPTTKTLLSIFSSNYTSDPHYIDLDKNHIILFLYALSYLDDSEFPNTREEKIKLLGKYNIEIDNLSNFALTYNLWSNKEYINKFAENKESLILDIQNILAIDSLDAKNKKVFIFENPSILSEIISKNIDVSVIISSGFINTSIYLIIDKLIKNDNKLYYNGDFDPEGLLIAQKLKEKYKEKIELFCYSKNDYEQCISKKNINIQRLNKLTKIDNKELLEIKELLKNNKLSAYQENNKDNIYKRNYY